MSDREDLDGLGLVVFEEVGGEAVQESITHLLLALVGRLVNKHQVLQTSRQLSISRGLKLLDELFSVSDICFKFFGSRHVNKLIDLLRNHEVSVVVEPWPMDIRVRKLVTFRATVWKRDFVPDQVTWPRVGSKKTIAVAQETGLQIREKETLQVARQVTCWRRPSKWGRNDRDQMEK